MIQFGSSTCSAISGAGGPDDGVRFILEGAPSKLRLGGAFPCVTDEL
jgi:hypothetical protein